MFQLVKQVSKAQQSSNGLRKYQHCWCSLSIALDCQRPSLDQPTTSNLFTI